MGRISASAYRNIRIKIHIRIRVRIRIQKGADADVRGSPGDFMIPFKYKTIAVRTFQNMSWKFQS